MFFEQAFKGNNHFGRYVLVTILVFLAYQIGTIPLMLALWRAVDLDPNLDKDDIQSFMTEPNFSNFGINTNLGLTLMLLLFVAALVAFYFLFPPIHRRAFRTLSTTKSRLNWSKIFFAFFLWMGLSLAAEGFNYFLSPDDYSWNFKLNTFLPLLLLCIFILPLQTSFEELFFRGYLMQGIGTDRFQKVIGICLGLGAAYLIYHTWGDALYETVSSHPTISTLAQANVIAQLACNTIILVLAFLFAYLGNRLSTISTGSRIHNYKIVPLIITSVLFGLMHSANPEIEKFGFGTMQIYYISAGLMLGIMTVMDDGLELALGTHAATNFTGAVFVGYDGAAITTDSILKSHSLDANLMTYAFLFLAIIFLIILKYKYKWSSFTKVLEPIDKPDEDQNVNQYIEMQPLA